MGAPVGVGVELRVVVKHRLLAVRRSTARIAEPAQLRVLERKLDGMDQLRRVERTRVDILGDLRGPRLIEKLFVLGDEHELGSLLA